ncbi:MAG: DUF3800 domain-containing protein [Candidatus Aenigmarchaeota archaeon]|nr:DUF3800 domain-containing protein [Candidatus Aenigmarchaeota archaeon]
MYIFIEESGDLGFDFKKDGKPSDFFLVGAIKAKDEKYLNRVLKRHRKRLKKKKSEKAEIKFSNTSHENKRRILEDIAKLDLEIIIVYIDKHKAYSYVKDDPLRMYSYLLKILAEKCFSAPLTEDTTIVFDRAFSKIQQTALELYLTTQNEQLLTNRQKVKMIHLPSHESQGLLCTDFVCGAAMKKLLDKNSTYFDVVEKRVMCFKKLF